MAVAITDLSGLTKVELSGRLDTMSVDQLETAFVAGIVPKGRHTVVDLTQVTFIASLAIRMLLSTARTLDRRGIKFVIFGAMPPVMEVIDTTALGEIVPVFATEAEAMAALDS